MLLSVLSFESGGPSLSRALTHGFSAHPILTKLLHGEQVGFGTIVQLIAENAADADVCEYIEFTRALGLPTSFAAVAVSDLSEAKLLAIAEKTAAARSPFNHAYGDSAGADDGEA